METIYLLHIISIKTTRWERLIGHPYRRQRKQIRKLIEERSFCGILTIPRIAEELGDLGVPYLYRKKIKYKWGGIRKNERKDWHLAILDDGTEQTDAIIERVSEDFNHMTVITEREEYFSDLAEDIYDETGLLIHFTDQIPRKANIVLDMKP